MNKKFDDTYIQLYHIDSHMFEFTLKIDDIINQLYLTISNKSSPIVSFEEAYRISYNFFHKHKYYCSLLVQYYLTHPKYQDKYLKECIKSIFIPTLRFYDYIYIYTKFKYDECANCIINNLNHFINNNTNYHYDKTIYNASNRLSQNYKKI